MFSTLGFIVLVGAVSAIIYYVFDYRRFKKHSDLHDNEMAILNKIDDELKRCYDEIDALEKLAGVHEKAENARSGPFLPTMPDAHYGSERWRREQKEIEKGDRDHLHHRLRDLYFSISDINLRKKLIAKNREASRLHVKWMRQSVAVAKASGNADDLKSAENYLAEAIEEPFLFSRHEEITGSPENPTSIAPPANDAMHRQGDC